MPCTYQDVLQHKSLGKPHNYDRQRVILYALGIGMGMDPLDERQLRFVLEDDLTVFPTFATVATWNIRFKLDLGIEWSKLIHLAQSLEILQPFPPEGRLLADDRIVAAFDKPKQNATVLTSETTITDADSGTALARLQMTTLARDFRVDGAPEGPSRPKSSRPDRKADTVVSMKTSPQVALIYRLLGGGAKIHSTPSVARAQGFDGPIMHGLSTWGHACHAILRSVADYDVGRLRQYSASFTAPVYPGEELAIHIWVEGDEVFFETRVPARDRLVLGNGRALLAPGS